MTSDKTFHFVQQLRSLDQRQKDLDFERGQLAAKIRSEFTKGESGDAAFSEWCRIELGYSEYKSRELLVRACTFVLIPDPKTFRDVIGHRFSAGVLGRLIKLPKNEQVATIEAAKAQGRPIASIIRQRGRVDIEPRVNYEDDAARLAQYIEYAIKDPPKSIAEILVRYRKRKAAA